MNTHSRFGTNLGFYRLRDHSRYDEALRKHSVSPKKEGLNSIAVGGSSLKMMRSVCPSLAAVAKGDTDFEGPNADLPGSGIHQIGFGEKAMPRIYKIVCDVASKKTAREMTVGIRQRESVAQAGQCAYATCTVIHYSG